MASRKDAKTQRILLILVVFASLRLGAMLSLSVANADEPSEITNSLGMRFVRIPAGEFLMGSPAGDDQTEPDELPQHAVRIAAPYYFGKFEVTQAEFELVTGENPSWYSSTGGGRDAVADRNTLRHPVEMVSWNDAVSFCRQLSDLDAERVAKRVYRLPTEAEWEYACRAGTTTRFAFGDAIGSSEMNFADPGANPPLPHITRPVGSYLPNAWGLHDMHGNVWEWCCDWYAADAYVTGMLPIDGNGRVVRGGSYQFAASQARSANRDFTRPTRRDWGNGLRVVVE